MKIIVFKTWPVNRIPVNLCINNLNPVIIRLLNQFLQNGIRIRLKNFFQKWVRSKLAVYKTGNGKHQDQMGNKNLHEDENTKVHADPKSVIGVLLWTSPFNETVPYWSGPTYLSFMLPAAYWLDEKSFGTFPHRISEKKALGS